MFNPVIFTLKFIFRISIISEEIKNSLVYKVYEYSVYLEAYIHHLKVLANSENVPLSKYVVDAGLDFFICI